MSLSGRSFVANALALSRIWYVASLVHMPQQKELNTLLFNFFLAGKKDKVSRKVVVQPKECRGFAVVSIERKTCALLVQWVKRLVLSPSAWVSLLTYWCFDHFSIGPVDVLSQPLDVSPSLLPPFYSSWRSVGGSVNPPPPRVLSINSVSGTRTPVSVVNESHCVVNRNREPTGALVV